MGRMCMTCAFIWSFFTIALVYYGQEGIMDFYTKQETVKDSMRSAWYVILIFILFDCL